MNKFTTVSEFLDSLGEKDRAQVVALRDIISTAYTGLEEHIKWNSPSYMLDGEDRITFSVRPGFPISIVLHMGATRPENKKGAPIMNDSFGLIDWKSDIRGSINFKDLEDIQNKSGQLVSIVNEWLKIPH